MDNPDMTWALKAIAVAFEPSRALSTYFQQCAEGGLRHDRPNLCDSTWECTSVVTCTSEYLSGLAQGLPSSAILVWRSEHTHNFGGWMQANPLRVASYRRVILFLSCGNIRRHGVFFKLPLSIAGRIDNRRPQADKDAILQDSGPSLYKQHSAQCLRLSLEALLTGTDGL